MSSEEGSGKYFSSAARFFPEFDRLEVEAFVESFQAHAENEVIPVSKIRDLMTYMGQNPTNSDLEMFRSQFDVDKHGGLDWKLFLTLMRFLDPIKSLIFAHDWIAPALDKFPEFSHEDILKWAELFRVYDYDGSGTISVGELRCVFKDQGMEISRDQAYDYFRLVGVNPDTDDLTWLDYLDVMRTLNPLKSFEFQQKWYEPAKKFPEWSRAEVRVFIQAFRDFDLDDSGTIDAHELTNALLAMGQGAKKERVETLMKKFGNQQGVIEWQQFLAMMSEFYPDQRKEFEKAFLEPSKKFKSLFDEEDINSLIESFQELDDDADRALSIRELGTILRQLGQGCSELKLSQLMRDFDKDRSGTIDFGEFLEIIASFYQPSTSAPTTNTQAAPKPTPAPATTSSPAPKPTPAPAPTSSPAPKPTTPAASTGSKIGSPAPAASGSKIAQNVCPGCSKVVYAAEKQTGVNNQWWHKLCFKCHACGASLTAGNWQEHDQQMYCKKDYQMKFSNQGYGAGRVQSFQS